MKITLSFRLLWMCGGLISALILGGTYLLEHSFGLEPCPLCLLQRYALWGVTLLFWLGVLQQDRSGWRLIFSASIIFFSVLGTIVSARHVWIQYLTPPAELEACTASLERLLAYTPLWEVVKTIFNASQDCARIDFTFLQLSLSVWSLLSFISILFFSVSLIGREIKRRI